MEKVMIRWISVDLRLTGFLSGRLIFFLSEDDPDRNDHTVPQHKQDRCYSQCDGIIPRFGAQRNVSRDDHGNSAENDLIIDRFQAQ